MAVGIVDRQKLVDIADAVRAKKGITGNMTLDTIAGNIASIPTADNNAKFDFSESGSKSSGKLLAYLTTIDLSNFDTSNVTDMGNMFSSCSYLTSLDLSNFDTSNVTNMGSMFSDCSSLTSLDVSNFNTSKVNSYYSFASMFSGCRSIKSLDLSSFDFSNTYNTAYTGMNNFLNDCSSLKTVTFPSTVTFKKSGISFNSMFKGCSSLTSLDFSGFDTSNVAYMRYMFNGCSSLTSLDLSNFNTSNVTDMGSMFSSCSSLTSLDLSNWDTNKVTTMEYMFNGCSSLTSLDLSNWNTSNVTNMNNMFNYCSKLSNLTLGTDWASNSSISSFSLSSCPLTHESAVDVINKLATRDNSPVITFHGSVGLYQSEIDVATNKGWSVSGCSVMVDAETATVGQYALIDGVLSICVYVADTPQDWGQRIFSAYSGFTDSNGKSQFQWGGYGTVTGINATEIGTGLTNTNALIAMNLQSTDGSPTVWDAIKEFRAAHGDRWFLPSKDEGLKATSCWTSSEVGPGFAWMDNESYGVTSTMKNTTTGIRPYTYV